MIVFCYCFVTLFSYQDGSGLEITNLHHKDAGIGSGVGFGLGRSVVDEHLAGDVEDADVLAVGVFDEDAAIGSVEVDAFVFGGGDVHEVTEGGDESVFTVDDDGADGVGVAVVPLDEFLAGEGECRDDDFITKFVGAASDGGAFGGVGTEDGDVEHSDIGGEVGDKADVAGHSEDANGGGVAVAPMGEVVAVKGNGFDDGLVVAAGGGGDDVHGAHRDVGREELARESVGASDDGTAPDVVVLVVIDRLAGHLDVDTGEVFGERVGVSGGDSDGVGEDAVERGDIVKERFGDDGDFASEGHAVQVGAVGEDVSLTHTGVDAGVGVEIDAAKVNAIVESVVADFFDIFGEGDGGESSAAAESGRFDSV